MRICATLLLVWGIAVPGMAQGPPSVENVETFQRPRLHSDADTNSWESYFDFGVAQLREHPKVAAAAFAWSSRLDPSRAEPLIGRWVAYWMVYPGWFEDYVADRRDVIESPAVVRLDSLFLRALIRNPLVPRNLVVLAFDQLPGEWRTDRYTQAVLTSAAGHYEEAARSFSTLIRSDSVKHVRVRWDLALCFTANRQYDSAAAEITALLAEMRRQELKRLTYSYDSRELLEYSLGLLASARGDQQGAREAMGRALVENLAFYPAHVALGELAMASGDTATTLAEYAQAAELAQADGVVHARYGEALALLGHIADAEPELRQAIALEPFYARPHFMLAAVLEARGQTSAALAEYRTFVDHAPKEMPLANTARQRIAALTASLGDSTKRP